MTTKIVNFRLDEEADKTFRELAAAKGITKTELMRQIINDAAEKNKLLLQKWREMEELRK